MKTLSEVMASLTPEQREAVETRFEALKTELAHAEGAAIIANDRPNEEFNEGLAQMNERLRAEILTLRNTLGWIADPSHDLSQEDTAAFFQDMARKALSAGTARRRS